MDTLFQIKELEVYSVGIDETFFAICFEQWNEQA